ncbi:three-Cys-motif partner protein TcmP [bacterium]|nr:three-Cys-motif partner protein TcmP [bacterium]
MKHRFGGEWTQQKLEMLRKYLNEYMKVMKYQKFQLSYIDAFAGTGYHSAGKEAQDDSDFLEGFLEEDSQEFLKGSATITLEIDRPFDEYVFIEKKRAHAADLESLRKQHPERVIRVVVGDANSAVQDICRQKWGGKRAVMFLDPYGLQVEWPTLKSIAGTGAIDLWILFPVGVAVNRMLPRDGRISEGWRKRLDTVFGTSEWFDRFYKTVSQPDMLGGIETTTKSATIESIGDYFVERLEEIFPSVAKRPCLLKTTQGRPLFLLCFAAGNPKGGPTALRIADHILRHSDGF